MKHHDVTLPGGGTIRLVAVDAMPSNQLTMVSAYVGDDGYLWLSAVNAVLGDVTVMTSANAPLREIIERSNADTQGK